MSTTVINLNLTGHPVQEKLMKGTPKNPAPYLQLVESLERRLPPEHVGRREGEGEWVHLGVRPRDGERVLLLQIGAALARRRQRRRRRRRLQALRVLQEGKEIFFTETEASPRRFFDVYLFCFL